ncbi:MAG: ferredoxin [Planctomycetota bacterium]
MRAEVDPDLCIACGLCEEACPEVFEVGDETAEVKVGEVPGELEDAVRDAAEDCPTDAISIEE